MMIKHKEAIYQEWATGKKAVVGVGIALAILTVAMGALLAYMHFSGIGIDKAGWTTLGNDIKDFWNNSYPISNLQVVIAASGAFAFTVSICLYRKYAHDHLAKKINQLRLNFRTWLVNRAKETLYEVPPPDECEEYDENRVRRQQCELALAKREASRNTLKVYMEQNNQLSQPKLNELNENDNE